MNLKITAPSRLVGSIELPASKSLSNRLLMAQALSEQPFQVYNLAQCDDVQAMQHALQSDSGTIDVGAAGTAMRLLTAFFSLQEGRTVVLDGCERMRCRPIGILVDALRALGANIQYCHRDGFPPLQITGTKLQGQELSMQGNVSSQFISAILLIAPIVGGITLHLVGEIASRPYIDMTVQLMVDLGVDAHWSDECTIHVPAGQYRGYSYVVEADWSAASYWIALQALLPSSSISLRGLRPHSLQGDSNMLDFVAPLGVKAKWQGEDLGLSTKPACCCCSTFADLKCNPDLAQTLVVLMCLMERPFRFTGLQSLRIKETDRLEALRLELAKLGYLVKIEGDDAMSWHFEKTQPQRAPLINTHGDHRMAMAMAMAAVRFPQLTIANAEVVSKSYPQYWQHLQSVGFTLQEC